MTHLITEPNPVVPPHAPSATGHQPVLVTELLQLLDPQPGRVCLDATLGRGGHAAAVIPLLAPTGRYVGLDLDPDNITHARDRFAHAPIPVDFLQGNFADAPQLLTQLGIKKVDLLIADLGFCSTQVDDPARGFSFQSDGPLDMRLDPHAPTTAAQLVNELDEQELADLIYTLGQDRLSRRIARKIVEARARSPINTTSALAQIVRQAYPRRRPPRRNTNARRPRPIDPATRTFMALRIAVNAELDTLQRLLTLMPDLLAPGATAAVISFHSLEDRLVKRAMTQWRRDGWARWLAPKPITVGHDERRANPRSRSAKLRAVRWEHPGVSPNTPGNIRRIRPVDERM